MTGFDPGDYRYELPTASVFQDVSQWIPLMLAAVDAELARPSVWLDSEAAEALGLVEDLKAYIQELDVPVPLIPIGTVWPYAGTEDSIPDGWLLCDGTEYTEADYFELSQVLTTIYGGSTLMGTFRVPDLRGRVIAGSGQGSGLSERNPGDSLGAETIALTTPNLPEHTHTLAPHTHSINDPGHSHEVQVRGNATAFGTSAIAASNQAATGTRQSNTANTGITIASTSTLTTSSVGSGSAHSNMQPTLIMHYIIRALR